MGVGFGRLYCDWFGCCLGFLSLSRGGLSWIVVFVLMLLIWGFFTKVFLGVLLVVICIFTFVLFSGCGVVVVVCGLWFGLRYCFRWVVCLVWLLLNSVV